MPASLPRYTSAGELFEAARCAAMERDSIKRQLEAVRASVGLSGVRYDGGSVSGTKADMHGDARLAAMVDHMERLKERVSQDEALLDACSVILYGPDGHGGVAKLAGHLCADAAFWRYLDGASWDKTARMTGVGRSAAMTHAAAALDTVDAYGIGRMLSGTGIAAD